MTYYEAGHMMYLHRESLEQLAMDLRRFVDAAK
jgi:carboxypeptidase C (cathepsin A)